MPDPKSTTDTKPADATAPTAPEAAAAPAAVKKEKTPIPEGFVAPVEFARLVDKHLNQAPGTTKPQIIYGHIKNSKSFPVTERSPEDYPRFIVNLKAGLEWVDGLVARRAEREAAKAAAPAPAATPPAPAEAAAKTS
jgi:hypothetical protein